MTEQDRHLIARFEQLGEIVLLIAETPDMLHLRAELLRKTGALSQLGGTRSIELEEGTERGVRAIDFDTGKTLWTTELHRGVPKPSRHPKNSYASETPVTDGQRVYFHIGDLATYCLDVKGKILWEKEWPLQATRYGYGTASSPVLHENRLYLLKDNEEESYLFALDKITGREIWRVERDEPTTWSTPYIWQNTLRTEIVTSGSKKIRSYDLNGKMLWEIARQATLAVPTPFSDDGLLD